MGKLNVVYVIKKTGQKVNICLWNRSECIALWSGPKSLCSCLLFECPLAVQSASPQMWKIFTVKWGSPGVRAAGKTDAPHSVSSQLVKYNIIVATIFMTFRTQIHKIKFGKNGFHNLQGTMSHRPLTNTSSLKITAAYCGATPWSYNACPDRCCSAGIYWKLQLLVLYSTCTKTIVTTQIDSSHYSSTST